MAAPRGDCRGAPTPDPSWRGVTHPALVLPAPHGVLQRCGVSLSPCLDGKHGGGMGGGEETPPLLLLWAYLGIIKSATGKRTAGAAGLLNPKQGPQLSQRARVMLGRMVAK